MPENAVAETEAPDGMVKVRLTIRPDEDTLVPEDEVPVLRHQGLLIEDAPDGSEPAQPPAGGPQAPTPPAPVPSSPAGAVPSPSAAAAAKTPKAGA